MFMMLKFGYPTEIYFTIHSLIVHEQNIVKGTVQAQTVLNGAVSHKHKIDYATQVLNILNFKRQ